MDNEHNRRDHDSSEAAVTGVVAAAEAAAAGAAVGSVFGPLGTAPGANTGTAIVNEVGEGSDDANSTSTQV